MPEKAHLIQYDIAEPQTEAQRIYSLQRQAYLRAPFPAYEERLQNLQKLEALFVDNEQDIIEAVTKDFGHRPVAETQALEMFLVRSSFRDIKKHLKKWMKPQRRKVTLFVGGKNRLIPQPKGVVGIVVPWNYPLAMVATQITISLAAGNRTLVKMAENSYHLRALLHKLIATHFDEEQLAIVPDARGSGFSSLPFDHLLFTGSPETGKTVMAAAAQNLCPVTLELGGKSPTVVCDDFDLETAVRRIVQYKFLNAGQTCLAPDYVFVPRAKVDRFVELAQKAATEFFPDTNAPETYTSIIDLPSYQRLHSWLQAVKDQGTRTVNLVKDSRFNDVDRKFPPHIVVDPAPESSLLTYEIFGPILPIVPYDSLDEVMAYIAVRDRPLALYLFTLDKSVQERVVYGSISGGVTINNCVVHAFQHHMPFGGVGASGIGQYHAFEGFMEFSKLRPVFTYPNFLSSEIMAPPYGQKHKTLYRWLNRLGL